jgi:uncharacterized Zn finger protein
MPEDSNHNQVTIQTIRAWASETIFKRGQDYQLRGRVRELAATSPGELVAWVQGSSRYATRVILNQERLSADCTCPYGGTCKHAVAVALAYLDRPDQARPLPLATANDPRIVLLDRKAAAATITSAPPTMSMPTGDAALTTFLSALSQQELVALLLDMARRCPELHDALAVRQMLASDDAGQLEAEVLGRIIAAGTASDWGDRWDDEAELPDYSPVYDGLKLLLDQGHADAVMRLGEELLDWLLPMVAIGMALLIAVIAVGQTMLIFGWLVNLPAPSEEPEAESKARPIVILDSEVAFPPRRRRKRP